ncbi:MAG TPA: diacylglycerol kinase [Burkholderiales bacterium]|nr:diacylglycerol kinase [Burkholderiales bacterium]
MENHDNPRERKAGLVRIWRAFLYSFEGISAAVRYQAAFRQEVLVAVMLIPIALLLPVSANGKALMVASVLLVLIVELVNSAIETVVDRISPEYHLLSKRAKDFGSAAVLLSLVSVALIWTLVLFA